MTTTSTTNRAWAIGLAAVAGLALLASAARAARTTLDIYFIDVEGGQSTLFVTPAGESLLVDTGFPGAQGGFDAQPGDPAKARDANRIFAAARDAGLSRIDYLLLTHFHADHDGGVVELAQLMPIGTFVDHGTVNADAERVEGTLKAFDRYAAVRAKGRHLEPAPGARLPLTGVEVTIVSAAGATIAKPLPGAGTPTAGCAASPPAAQEPTENPRSTGFQLRFGRFRALDVGDFSGPPLYALACPKRSSARWTSTSSPTTAATTWPTRRRWRRSIPHRRCQQRRAQGGAAVTLAALQTAGIDTWQLHRSENPGAHNTSDASREISTNRPRIGSRSARTPTAPSR